MFDSRLKKLRKVAGYTQAEFAKKIGVATSTVGMWESGSRRPDYDTLKVVAEALGVSMGYLLGEEELITPSSIAQIPVVASVRAGFDGGIQEEHMGTEPALGIRNAEEFRYVRVRGDSMLPQIEEGDLALVHLQSDVESGELAVVIVDGEDAMIKKVVKEKEGYISLVSINPNYPPRKISGEQLERIIVYGKVYGITRSFL